MIRTELIGVWPESCVCVGGRWGEMMAFFRHEASGWTGVTWI